MADPTLPDLFSIMPPVRPRAKRGRRSLADSITAAGGAPSPLSPRLTKLAMGDDAADGIMGGMASNMAGNDITETVAAISTRIKKTMEQQFDHVRVLGEISGFKQAPSGHGYFNLKDQDEKEKSLLNCFLLKHKFSYLPFKPADGMMVVATGKISTYGARSNYQLFVDGLELAGSGNLLQILEQRKQKLLAEGLFDPARKKPLPTMPTTIGVVTSPTGAVIRDIIHRVTARFPCHIILYPVLVQGDGAPADICRAIAAMNELVVGDETLPRPDVLIIARGGGSLEDLWAFNEESVVRAVAASVIPTISAIGHETDTTLVDFAADLRAPTPTAAAELALPFLLADLRQRLADTHQQMARLADRTMGQRAVALNHWRARVLSPVNIIMKKSTMVDHCGTSLRQWQDYFFQTRGQQLANLARLLQSLSYKKTLARGYAIARQHDTIVARKKNLNPNQPLQLEFADGVVEVNKAQP